MYLLNTSLNISRWFSVIITRLVLKHAPRLVSGNLAQFSVEIKIADPGLLAGQVCSGLLAATSKEGKQTVRGVGEGSHIELREHL